MRTATRLHCHQAWGQRGEKPDQLRTRNLFAKHNVPGRVGAVRLENPFGNIQPDRANFHDGRLPV
ncbi:MAG TPA: hypothetical protein ENH55_19785 [Aurantimonas coralicida]|uniref:Uncharacterized protein n=1 Tax=Aurantimonas coralicida TaxID=182270 RepID=A0A9C9TG94_9HYPH|nr:hypothetical protein [Aurantimonas coralicida]HET99505.1 hypothetical protein [Aurantimonas coralicida]